MNEVDSAGKPINKPDNSLLISITRWSGLHRAEQLLLLVSLFIVWFSAVSAINLIHSGYEQRVENQLTTLLKSAGQSIQIWSHDRKAVVENLATDEALLKETESLLQSPRDKRSLLTAPEQERLRNMFLSFLKGGNLRGFFIIDRNNISLASSRDINVGTVNLLAEQPDLIRKMWQGKVVISQVQLSDVPMPKQTAVDVGTRDLNMFVGSPIRDQKGRIIALLTLRIDPNATLFALLDRVRPGHTGEAYLFDRQGLMLSPSRFRKDLINMGLIKPNESSVTRVYIRDNSESRTTGLTRMAASATQGNQGFDISGYPDYRGIKVVGAWQWEKALDLGLTVEQDFDEAYALFFEMRSLIYAAGMVASIALLLLALFFGRGRRRVQETQNRLSAVVEHTVDSVVVINHLGIIESVNPAVEKVFGYQASELLGNNVSMLMPEPHRGVHNDYISRFMDSGDARVIGIGREVEAIRSDGSLFPAELTVSRFELDSGTHFAGTLRDLTQRKKAEAELEAERKSNEITKRALERGNIGEFWVNVHTAAILRVNDWACDYLKYSREELLNMTIPEIAPEFPMELFPQTMEEIRGQGWARLESFHRARDGSVIPLEFIVDYVKAKDAKDDIIIAFSLDISERKQIEDELRMMSLVAAETDNGVVVTGLDQKIKWVNPGFTDITGYDFDEVIGRKPGDFLHGPKTEQDAVSCLGTAIRKQERVATDITNYGKNGEPYILHIEIMPIRDESGEVVEFIALESNVTEQRRADKEIKEAKEAAELANRAKSSFLAAMSHEIRTPLNGVVGTIDLLEHTRLESNQRDMVRTARDSSLTLMGIIDDVLDFSKIEAGKLELDDAPVSLQRVVEGCVESMQPLAAKNNIELLVFCEPAIPEVMGDLVRLRQILLNLTGNAIKFSAGLKSGRQGRVEVSAALESVEEQDVKIRLSVKDNGIGMSADAQEKLFRPFVQAESSTTRRFGGTGLGLAISRRLVEMMGGHIEVESRLDQGACFSVALTMKVALDQQVTPDSGLAGLQVLLVKGHPEAVRIIDVYLRFAGVIVTLATPADALERFKTLVNNDGEVLLVIDSQGEEERTNQMRAEMRKIAAGKKELRFLMIGRGRRRYVRPSAEDGMALDINAMRRSTLVNAVASLAGLESPEQGDQEQDYSYIIELPTREEAKAEGRLVLVAEDNETNRNVLRQQLAMLGFVAEMAEDGVQALEMWRKERYPLLLTDCHMPELDGYNLARAIREEEGDIRHTNIVAITADALKGTAEKCLAAGMDDYVTKPMQIPELRGILEKWSSDRPVEQGEDLLPDVSAVSPSIDPEALSSLLGSHEPEMLARFYADFLETSMTTVEQIKTAHAKGDLRKAGELAHKLKSAARTVGANELADCCLAIEQAGKAGNGQDLDLQVSRFSLLFEEVCDWLEQRNASEQGRGK
ncbi:PAS domain S-box protein [Mariprofundus ferrooxydans]|uniref:Sensor protein FixL n=1 Tax=Mariprofundus ferrooxydans PV-1 TaxID=314345 RepID=Q0EYZ0_9PROT|nr:multi-sensor hybrid histidine kinase [Mariprofundus ferrooxydans PV-1]